MKCKIAACLARMQRFYTSTPAQPQLRLTEQLFFAGLIATYKTFASLTQQDQD